MHEQPYIRQEPIDFDSAFLKVLCLASTETVKGLQWALDRMNFSDRKYKLFLGNLQNLSAHGDADIVIISIDLGQPVPVESLKKVSGKPGLCLLTQPTPQQLLQIGDLSYWHPFSWDGVNFEKLALKVDEMGLRYQEEIKRCRFVDSARNYLLRESRHPEFIEWLNPPEKYSGMRIFQLDVLRGVLSVGGAESPCDIRVPVDFDQRAEIGEFRFINGKWSFKPYADRLPVRISGKKDDLASGDQLEVQRYLFQLKKSQKMEELMRLSKRLHVLDDADVLKQEATQLSEVQTIGEMCRELLTRGASCELRVSAGTKTGSIFFNDGFAYHAVTGSVNGLKALTRILAWQNPQWKLNLNKMSPPDRGHFRMVLKEFVPMYELWKGKWAKISPMMPPLSLKLRMIPNRFMVRQEFNIQETKVLAALCEYHLVRDIMNFCNEMHDVDIAMTLVNLRRQGLIEPLKN